MRVVSFARKFGWVLVVTVLLLFLFPLQFGSFTQTHGPTTAMRALMAVQTLLMAIALSITIAISLVAVHRASETEETVVVEDSGSTCLQLRC